MQASHYYLPNTAWHRRRIAAPGRAIDSALSHIILVRRSRYLSVGCQVARANGPLVTFAKLFSSVFQAVGSVTSFYATIHSNARG